MQSRPVNARRVVVASLAFAEVVLAGGAGAWGQCVAPSIGVQPSGGNVHEGFVTTLSVVAGGTGPLAYQWSRDGEPLTDGGRFLGTTSATLRITRSLVTDSGEYTVRVTNECGSVGSDGAAVDVVCIGDWNFSGEVNSQDFFDLLDDLFSHSVDFPSYWGCPVICTSEVFFEFLTAFFSGC